MPSVAIVKDFFRRAREQTKADLGVSWRTTVTYCTMTLVPVLLSYWRKSGKQAMSFSDSLEPIAYGLCGMVLTFVVHFLWNLWLAPYYLLKEREDEIKKNKGFGSLNAQLEPIRLTDFSDYGHHQTIELFAAACLWVGLAPALSSERFKGHSETEPFKKCY